VKSNIATKSATVNADHKKCSSQLGTRLVPITLQRKGFPAETFYVPECFECGRTIFDFRAANVSVVGETDEELTPLGSLYGADAFLIPSRGAFLVHKECDATGRGAWVAASCVFKNDQRFEFEKQRRGAA
jgi:hypothetical protein